MAPLGTFLNRSPQALLARFRRRMSVPCEISERLRQQGHQEDLVDRIGGDELVVVLDGVSDLDSALQLAETLHQQAAQPLQLEGETITITLSVGVSLTSPEETPDLLLVRADAAMKSAKQQGRNRVISLEPT
jgi:diguanylate cyclase (GGDEF)-like protein